MKVLLLNIDSKLPNIALKKVEMWHKQQGDEIIWDMPMMLGHTDRAYASCIFTKNKGVMENYKGLYPELITGGTGYDLTAKLPPHIEAMKPKINIGFTTRGCFRWCSFCLVCPSEGDFRITGDIYDFWDGVSKWLTCLDNNILIDIIHFEKICRQCQNESIAIDYNQGLDIRLVDGRVCQILKQTRIRSELRFAFDRPSLEGIIREKVSLLNEYKVRSRYFFYVLVGFDTTFEEDLYRCNVIKELGCRAYVMRHENTPKERRYIRLAEWANQMWTFDKYPFEEFCQRRAMKNTRRL